MDVQRFVHMYFVHLSLSSISCNNSRDWKLGRFSAILYKGDTISDFLFALLHTKHSTMKEFAAMESKFLPFKIDPFSEGRQNKFAQVDSPENVLVSFKLWFMNFVEFTFQVSAIDHDAGHNGQVIYSVRGRSDLEDKFQIDSLTGRITLTSPLTESDVGKEINLSVQASDNG